MNKSKISNPNIETGPRKPLSKYVDTDKNRFSLIYIIIFSIFWMGWVIRMFHWNLDNTTEKLWDILFLSIFLLFWCFFLGFGIYNVYKKIKRKNLEWNLLLEWNRLIATVTDIKSAWIMLKFWDSVMLWRWSWFKIHAEYKDRVFISPKIWINVPKYIKIWDKIPVFVDIQNPKEYHMDLDNINSV